MASKSGKKAAATSENSRMTTSTLRSSNCSMPMAQVRSPMRTSLKLAKRWAGASYKSKSYSSTWTPITTERSQKKNSASYSNTSPKGRTLSSHHSTRGVMTSLSLSKEAKQVQRCRCMRPTRRNTVLFYQRQVFTSSQMKKSSDSSSK